MYVLGDMINGVQAYFVPIVKGNSFSERISWWLMSAIGARILQIYILFQRNPQGLPWFLPKRNPGGDSLRKTKQLKQIRHNGLPGTAPKKPNNIDKKNVCSNLARLAGQEPSRDDANSIVWIHIRRAGLT